MQYSNDEKGGDLKQSQIELLQKQFEAKLISESVESLDSFLPKLHCKTQEQLEQLELEHRIVLYLRSMNLEFKTDPRVKEHKFQQKVYIRQSEKQNKQLPILKQVIDDAPESPSLIQEESFQDEDEEEAPQKKQFNTWLNPFVQRRQCSSEL